MNYIEKKLKNDELMFICPNLEQILRQCGVDKNHIEKMKEKKLIHNPEQEQYSDYDNTEKTPRLALVPLDKVIGTCRCDDATVFENVEKMKFGDREPHRFQNCFAFLETNPLNEVLYSYQKDISPVDMTCYTIREEDKVTYQNEYGVSYEECYYLSNDGNHRTLTAMLAGASHISAKVSMAYFNFEKKKKYEKVQEFFRKYHIKEGVFKYRYGNEYSILFQDENGIYQIDGFERTGEDILKSFSETIDNDLKVAKKLETLPEFIQNLFFKAVTFRLRSSSKKYIRIRQYLHKHYIENDTQYRRLYRECEHVYLWQK